MTRTVVFFCCFGVFFFTFQGIACVEVIGVRKLSDSINKFSAGYSQFLILRFLFLLGWGFNYAVAYASWRLLVDCVNLQHRLCVPSEINDKCT